MIAKRPRRRDKCTITTTMNFDAAMAMLHGFLVVLCAALLRPHAVNGYSEGAPQESCYNLLALHTDPNEIRGDVIPPETSCLPEMDCHYNVSVSFMGTPTELYYRCGDTHEIKIEFSHLSAPMSGFLIQGRVSGSDFNENDEIVGEFGNGLNWLQVLCNSSKTSGEGPYLNSATQNEQKSLHSIVLPWRAPSPSAAPINVTFWVTIVENSTIYYAHLRGPTLAPHPTECQSSLTGYKYLEEDSTLTMSFKFPVDTFTCDPTALIFQNHATRPTLMFSPRFSAVCTGFYEVQMTLDIRDHSALLSPPYKEMFRSISTSFLAFGSDFMMDIYGSPIRPILSSDALQVSEFINASQYEPILYFVALDFDDGILTFRYDVPIDASSFDPANITLACDSRIFNDQYAIKGRLIESPYSNNIVANLTIRLELQDAAVICCILSECASQVGLLASTIPGYNDPFGYSHPSTSFPVAFTDIQPPPTGESGTGMYLILYSEIYECYSEYLNTPGEIVFSYPGVSIYGVICYTYGSNTNANILYSHLDGSGGDTIIPGLVYERLTFLEGSGSGSGNITNGSSISQASLFQNETLADGVYTCISDQGDYKEVLIVNADYHIILLDESEVITATLGFPLEFSLQIATSIPTDPKNATLKLSSSGAPPPVPVFYTNEGQVLHVRFDQTSFALNGTYHVEVCPDGNCFDIEEVFTIIIEAPQIMTSTSLTNATNEIVFAEDLLEGIRLYCVSQYEDLSIDWFEYISGDLVRIEESNEFSFSRNGQVLEVHFSIKLTSVSSLACSIADPFDIGPLYHFPTTVIPGKVSITLDDVPLEDHVVFSANYTKNDLTLRCLGTVGHGQLVWTTTVAGFLDILQISTPNFTIVDNDINVTLTIINYRRFDGTFTCQSLQSGQEFHVHLQEDVCMCCPPDIPDLNPTIFNLCNETIPQGPIKDCMCSSPLVGDGYLCTVDSDGDQFPDQPLPNCEPRDNAPYCSQDICPEFSNSDQVLRTLDDVESTSNTSYGVAILVEGDYDGILLPPEAILNGTEFVTVALVLRCLSREEEDTVEWSAEGSTDFLQLFDSPTSQGRITQCRSESNVTINGGLSLEGTLRCTSQESGASVAVHFVGSRHCMCSSPFLEAGVEPDRDLAITCGSQNCECLNSQCRCLYPYVGYGNICTMDCDGDGFPNEPLQSCRMGDTGTFCQTDNCVHHYNPEQDPRACEDISEIPPGFSSCPSEVDDMWSIQWEDTYANHFNTQPCPGGQDISQCTGTASRYCMPNGTWTAANVSLCGSTNIEELTEQAAEAFDEMSDLTLEERVEIVDEVIRELTVATNTSDETVLYPQDLSNTNQIISGSVQILRASIQNNTLDRLNQELIQVFDNVLEQSNTASWMQLQEVEAGGQQLLTNAEQYGLYVAEALASDTVDTGGEDVITLNGTFLNIVLEAKQQEAADLTDVVFPQSQEPFMTTPKFGNGNAQIKIPAQLLKDRADEAGSDTVSTISIVMVSIADFLPVVILEDGTVNETTNETTTIPATMVLSSQIIANISQSRDASQSNTSAQLVFTTNKVKDSSNPRCAFWKFSMPIGNGGWAFEGVKTITSSKQGDQFHVVCETQHLTSFAVMVDVTGTDDTGTEALALEIVSYVGCSISLFFLFVTIVFFLTFRKKLFTSVHYFIHLNLAVSLFLAFATFVSGIENARESRIACAIVAALLHYFFLAAFCWMLCEGIMLYLLLVVVFTNKVSKSWWLYLIIGWGLPVIVVGISVGIAHDQYGAEGLGFCWISVEKGAIWAFAGPMLAIICINIFFWIMALRSLYKVTKAKYDKPDTEGGVVLAKKLLMASVILLPLLGITWVFGLLTVNENTTWAAWIFTIFNSLQGLFIFIFHVLRSDKVWKKLVKLCPCAETSKPETTSTTVRSTSTFRGRSTTQKKHTTRRKRKTNKEEFALSSDAVIVFENPLMDTPFKVKGSDEIGLTARTLVI